jgi:hypothetical protein
VRTPCTIASDIRCVVVLSFEVVKAFFENHDYELFTDPIKAAQLARNSKGIPYFQTFSPIGISHFSDEEKPLKSS